MITRHNNECWPVIRRLYISSWLYLGLFLACSAASVCGQSTRPGMGAIPYGDGGTGVSFRVWAPNASSVHVAGSFNGWNTGSHALSPDATGHTWSIDVSDAAAGDQYKYIINGLHWRTDPRARAHASGDFKNSVVCPTFEPPPPFARPSANEMIIYELHIGTFFDPDTEDDASGTFSNAIERLAHLQDMGVNAVCVMPVSEFFTERSWGYNPSGHFAIERDYGGYNGFQRFIEACHARGIAVLIDIVHNHWGESVSPGTPIGTWGTPVGDLWQFDASSASTDTGGIYFYEDSQQDSTPWGPRPCYDQPHVRSFILDSLRMFLDMGCDGFRWDAVDHIIRVDGGGAGITNGITLLQEAAQLIRDAGAINIAENSAAAVPGIFDAQWDYNFYDSMAFSLSFSNTSYGAAGIASALNNVGTSSVVFVENHDTAGLLNHWAERWPRKIRSGDDTRQRILAMTGTALAWLSHGTPMLFQGQETLETNLWHDNRPTDWSFDPPDRQAVAFHRDLCRLRRNLDGISGGMLSTSLQASSSSGMIYITRGTETDGCVVAIVNLNDETNTVNFVFPATGSWYRVLCTADEKYGTTEGGSVEVVAGDEAVDVHVPTYAVLFLSQSAPPNEDWDGDGLPNGWETTYFGNPTNGLAAADNDKDGFDNYSEWLAGTDPNNPESHVSLATDKPASSAFVLRFPSASNRVYDIYHANALDENFLFVTNLLSTPPLNTYTVPTEQTTAAGFYRLRARMK